jgi:hypothetical protein
MALRFGNVAFGRRRAAFRLRPGMLFVLALAGLLPACTAAPSAPLAGPDPSDPSARVAAVRYRSTTAPYASRRPVEPKPWQEQNIQVAPQSGASR